MLTNADKPLTGRLAPTPSGYLHLGNVANFLLTWLILRKAGGKLLLRIDDMDAARVRTAYLDDIFTTLEWLGIDYDEGPAGVDDFTRHWRQHMRLPLYETWLNKLEHDGDVYACTCSRKEVRLRYPTGFYGGYCRGLHHALHTPGAQWRVPVQQLPGIQVRTQGEAYAMVLLAEEMGDPVVRKKDGMPSYQLASMADDVFFGVNVVVRGADLLPSTACQLHLHRLVSGNLPAIQFVHHPLMKDEAGNKLAKSEGATSIRHLRQQGAAPGYVFEKVCQWFGWPITKKSPAVARDLLGVVDV